MPYWGRYHGDRAHPTRHQRIQYCPEFAHFLDASTPVNVVCMAYCGTSPLYLICNMSVGAWSCIFLLILMCLCITQPKLYKNQITSRYPIDYRTSNLRRFKSKHQTPMKVNEPCIAQHTPAATKWVTIGHASRSPVDPPPT